MGTIDTATPEEEVAREQLLERHPDWDVTIDPTRRWVIRDRHGALLGRHLDIAIAAKIAQDSEGPGFPANAGLGHYTTSELNKAEANARAQLLDNPGPEDRERLTRRLEAIRDERESRRPQKAAMTPASWVGPSSERLHDDRRERTGR